MFHNLSFCSHLFADAHIVNTSEIRSVSPSSKKISYVTFAYIRKASLLLSSLLYTDISVKQRDLLHPYINALIITRLIRWKITSLIATRIARTCSAFFKTFANVHGANCMHAGNWMHASGSHRPQTIRKQSRLIAVFQLFFSFYTLSDTFLDEQWSTMQVIIDFCYRCNDAHSPSRLYFI